MCTSGYTPPPEKNKNTQTGTHRHIRPQMSTQDTSTLAVCIHVHPLSAMYSSLDSPRCVHPRDSRLQRRTGISLEGARKRRMKGPSAQTRRGRALGPPVRPPSALTMDAGLVRHGSAFGSLVPSERSAWSWPGSTRLAWTQSSGGCGGGAQLRAASRAVPQDPPPARSAPGGRGRQRRALVPRVRAAGTGVRMAVCRAATTTVAQTGPPGARGVCGRALVEA
nr:uncharacterized protein LOC121830979 isoform X1 [Peromyscus maniculatus bairdii]